jgi:hypothetical protein
MLTVFNARSFPLLRMNTRSIQEEYIERSG